MEFDHNHYVPCLRWKQGEYQAVLGLRSGTRKFITPLIEIPEIGFDFEKQAASTTIDKHLAPFAKRVRAKWGTQPYFMDGKHIPSDAVMADGLHPITFLFDQLQAARCRAIPVTGIARNARFQKAVKKAVAQAQLGVCLRVTLEETAGLTLKKDVDALLEKMNVQIEHSDFILDLGAPNFKPIEGFTKLVELLITRLPHLNRWRTLTLLGTSFPPSMAEIKGKSATIPRWEWILYKRLVKSLKKNNVRLPTFGDYAINHPNLLPLDMRLLKPCATIRYTTDEAWLIVKGSNVRDNGFQQYQKHCQTVKAFVDYEGPGFSEGDRYIFECATGAATTGNLTTWRKIGTNHHLEKVAQNISSLFGS